MTFRYARHTVNLKRMETFYTEIVGLKKLGDFVNHNQYDGLFLGIEDAEWHLEFTVSPESPTSTYDEDDILVFYLDTKEKLVKKKQWIVDNKIKLETPKNPYWKENGIMISDPDGYSVVFAFRAYP